MKRRGPLLTLIVFVLLIGTWFGIDIVQSRKPLLGLDLQGGLSAIYSPVENASADDLVVIRDLMRDQLTSFGIAEPDVRVEGSNIVVDLPGVSDTNKAFEALQVSGIVTLRPVYQCGQAPADTATDAATATGTPITTTPDQVSNVGTTGTAGNTGTADTNTGSTPADTGSGTGNSDPVPTFNPNPSPSTPASSGTAGTGNDSSGQTSLGRPDESNSSVAGASGASRHPMTRSAFGGTPGTTIETIPTTKSPAPPATPTSVSSGSTGSSAPPTTVPAVPEPSGTDTPVTTPVSGTTLPETLRPPGATPVTTPGTPADGGQTIMQYPSAGQVCIVGPSGGTGEVFERGSARAAIDNQNGQWVVTVDLKPEGNVLWNQLATECFNTGPTCPSQQLAIALDDEIKSAPTVNEPTFSGTVQITGSFEKPEAESLARTLNRGAFPVEIQQQRLETVSPTAGTNSLNAAVIAGLIGIAVMLLFMILYYRRLSVVIIPGLLVWGMTVYALATAVSHGSNYSLSLAGTTGIIVAVGVTVDTYVVYFERLREEVRHGRTYRNSAERSFRVTWRTIMSADLVSLMASAVLFLLSVGSVKGFALYLGLTTVCDLVVFYFFTRPFVAVLARRGWLDRGTAVPAVSSTAGANS